MVRVEAVSFPKRDFFPRIYLRCSFSPRVLQITLFVFWLFWLSIVGRKRRRIVTNLRAGLDSRPDHEGFMVKKRGLELFFSK